MTNENWRDAEPAHCAEEGVWRWFLGNPEFRFDSSSTSHIPKEFWELLVPGRIKGNLAAGVVWYEYPSRELAMSALEQAKEFS